MCGSKTFYRVGVHLACVQESARLKGSTEALSVSGDTHTLSAMIEAKVRILKCT